MVSAGFLGLRLGGLAVLCWRALAGWILCLGWMGDLTAIFAFLWGWYNIVSAWFWRFGGDWWGWCFTWGYSLYDGFSGLWWTGFLGVCFLGFGVGI